MALTESESVMTTTRLPQDASGRPEHLVEHVRIGGINRNDHVRLEATEQSAEALFSE